MIRKGILLPDSEPVGVGVNDARRGIVDTGECQLDVIFKRIDEPELAAELFCAVLARELALPVPEPLLVFDPLLGTYVFGSVNLEYPNSLRYFNVNPNAPDAAAVRVLIEAVRTWARAKEVAAFDEWIHNRDRNLGNLLYAGPGDFAIIDHGKALDVDPNHASANVLFSILDEACTDERARRALLRSLQRVAASFDMMHAESPYSSLSSTGVASHAISAENFFNLVDNRLENIASLLINRLPGQQGLLVSSQL